MAQDDSSAANDPGLVVVTATSDLHDTRNAIDEILTAVMRGRDRTPDFISVHYGASRRVHDLWPLIMAAFGGSAVHGASSCKGVMTQQGILDAGDDAIGVFALWDRAGAFGSAMEPLGDCARTAARMATQAALRRAGRSGEVPEIVWLAATPGQEEAVLDGVRDLVGTKALIVGGSAADSAVSGAWSVFSSDDISADGVVVSVLFTSTPVSSVYASGYAPTNRRGIVTAAHGRRLLEIDGRPAAEVYRQWCGHAIDQQAADRAGFLVDSALAPLGRKLSDHEGIESFLMAHPAGFGPDGSLDVFADVIVGEELHLMTGSRDSLVHRAGRIARQCRDGLAQGVPAGALVVYCGGCMMAVRERMSEVVSGLNASLGGAPFLGLFTFGEQGEILDHGARHANLMISCTAFAASEADALDQG